MRNCHKVKEPIIQHVKPSVSQIAMEMLGIAQAIVSISSEISTKTGLNIHPGVGLVHTGTGQGLSGLIGSGGIKQADLISLMSEVGSAQDSTIARQATKDGLIESGELVLRDDIRTSVRSSLDDFVPSMSLEQVKQLNSTGTWGIKGTTKSGVKVSVRGFL